MFSKVFLQAIADFADASVPTLRRTPADDYQTFLGFLSSVLGHL